MVAFAIRSASATLPNTRPSAVHTLNHPLPVTPWLIACLSSSAPLLWPILRIAQVF
jgi:hypothetical protein